MTQTVKTIPISSTRTENWDNENAWSLNSSNYTTPPSNWLYAADAEMGGKYSLMYSTSKIIFDHTKPFLWSFRAKVRGAQWAGVGILLSTEAWYQSGGNLGYTGVTNSNYGIQLFNDIYDQARYYAWDEFFEHPYYDWQTADVEMEWIPSVPQWRARKKILRTLIDNVETIVENPTWTSWTTQSIDLTDFWPVLMWTGATGAGLYEGPMTFTGSFVFGGQDGFNFEDWTYSSWAADYYGPDASNLTGGLCCAASENPANHYVALSQAAYTTTNVAAGQTWWAKSPAVGLDTSAKYKELWWDAVRTTAGDGSYLKIYIRDNADDSLISDDYIPGNSTGDLMSYGTDLLAAGSGRAHIKKISLADIPAGTTIYIDVQGKTTTTAAPATSQPMLAGAWVTFEGIGTTTFPSVTMTPQVTAIHLYNGSFGDFVFAQVDVSPTVGTFGDIVIAAASRLRYFNGVMWVSGAVVKRYNNGVWVTVPYTMFN